LHKEAGSLTRGYLKAFSNPVFANLKISFLEGPGCQKLISGGDFTINGATE
jgi:hypothetical protein